MNKLNAIAEDITACGGTVETAILDALDEQAVEEHMRETVKHAGEVDISFNAIVLYQPGRRWKRSAARCRWNVRSMACGPFACSRPVYAETPLIDEVWDIHGKANGITFEQFHSVMEGMTHRRQLTTIEELTNAAIFVASDEGSGITGTVFNLTAGMVC